MPRTSVFYEQCWTSDEYRHDDHGYMYVTWQKRNTRAHRLSFFLHYGFWPKVCRHTCDNPPCYNPTHLLDGTQADNVADAVRRGRARGGRLFGNRHAALNDGMPNKRTDNAAYLREKRRRVAAGTWVSRG